MKESNLDKKIKKYCKENNIWCVKIWGGGYQSAGIPDLIMCCKGKFVAFENKIGKNKTSKLQDYHIQKINDAGGIAMAMYDIEDAIKVLTSIT